MNDAPHVFTLWEMYASLVALRVKLHETRGWPTAYRGWLYLHGAKVWGRRQRDAWAWLAANLEALGYRDLPAAPALGLIVCRCRVASCMPTVAVQPSLFAEMPAAAVPESPAERLCGDWSPGRFAFRLEDVTPLPRPIPWVGSQGKPRPAPPLLVAAVEEQIGPPPPIPAEDAHARPQELPQGKGRRPRAPRGGAGGGDQGEGVPAGADRPGDESPPARRRRKR